MTGKRTKEQQLQVGKEWNEAKAKGVKIEDFCAAAGLGTISVANYERAYRKSLGVTATAPAAVAAPTDFKATKQAFEKIKTEYLQSLTGEVSRIKRAMITLQDELAAAEQELADFIKQNPVRESDVTSLAELQKEQSVSCQK